MSRVINYMENLTTFAYMNPTWASFPPFFASPNSLRVPDEKKNHTNKQCKLNKHITLPYLHNDVQLHKRIHGRAIFYDHAEFGRIPLVSNEKKMIFLYTSLKTSSLERISESNRFCFLAQLFTDPSNAGFQPHFAFA